MSYQRPLTSRVGSSRNSRNSRPISPFRTATQTSHKSEIMIDKSNFTEITVATKDEDVPYIALYKPNINKQKRRIQAATKINFVLQNSINLKIMYALQKILTEEPREKLLNLRTLYLGARIHKMILRKKEATFKCLVVNKIKRNGVLTGAKIIWKIQKSLLQRNIKSSMTDLKTNRLKMVIKELSNENEQAMELTKARAQVFRFNEQAYSKELIQTSKSLQRVTNYDSILQEIQQSKYSEVLQTEVKRFQQMRFSSSPRKKDLLDNETVIVVTTNIISAFQKTVSDYQGYCQQLQNELASYKDAEGINELKEVIRDKDRQMKEIENYIAQNNKMDIELKKFTAENRFMMDRISSTLSGQEKKMQNRLKSLGQTPIKMATSRIYLSGVMTTLVKKMGELQSHEKEIEAERKEVQRNLNIELRESRASIDSLEREINQERSKLSLLLEKKDAKRSLQQLKRKWKGDEHGKSLIDFLLSQHQTIEQLQRKEQQINNQQQTVSGGIEVVKNYLSTGLEKIEAVQPPPRINRNQNVGQGFNEILGLSKQILDLAYKRSRQHKESSEKISVYESQVQQYKEHVPEILPTESQVISSASQQLSTEQLLSHLKNSEKQFQKLNEQSKFTIVKKIDEQTSTLIKQLKRNKQELESKIIKKSSAEGQNQQLKNQISRIEEIITIISQSQNAITALAHQNTELTDKIEQMTQQHRNNIDSLQQQLTENNRLIRQLLTHKTQSPGKQASQQLYQPLMLKNQELLSKIIQLQKQISKWKEENNSSQNKISQLQQQILRKSREKHQNVKEPSQSLYEPLMEKNEQLLSKLIILQKEISKWKEENMVLLDRIAQLEGQIMRKSRQKYQNIGNNLEKQMIQSASENRKLIQDMRERFTSIEKYFQQPKQAILNQSPTDQNRIRQLMEQLRQSEKHVTDLSSKNAELSSKLMEMRIQYQNQLKVEQSTSTNKRFHLQQQLDQLKLHYQETYRQQIQDLKKYKEECFALRSKISDLENQGSHKNTDFERLEYRLRQSENQLASEREKVSSLQTELTNLSKQLGRSHTETDQLAIDAREQIRKITMVIRSLEEELDKKTKDYDTLQEEWNQKENIIINLQRDNNGLHQQLKETLEACSSLQAQNQDLSKELTHLKAQFYSIQAEFQSGRKSAVHSHERLSNLQNEIKQKEETINNILSRSKATSDHLNQQIYDAREDLLKQERKFQEQLSVKNSLINRLEHKIIELQNSERDMQQRCIMLENSQKQTPESTLGKKDREIQLLHQQIASLQQFLGDVSKAYKQLQGKYHEEKHRFGRFYDNAQQQRSLDQIDKAIHSLHDSSELSQEVRSLVVNNEQLQISLEELEEEKRKLLEKSEAQPAREYVVELLFNILLGAKHLSPQSPRGNLLWNQLIQINQRCSEVGELFTELEKFSLKLLTISSE